MKGQPAFGDTGQHMGDVYSIFPCYLNLHAGCVCSLVHTPVAMWTECEKQSPHGSEPSDIHTTPGCLVRFLQPRCSWKAAGIPEIG